MLWLKVGLQGEDLKDTGAVFPVGETLTYDVRWDPPAWMFFLPSLTAGEMTFQVNDPVVHGGKKAHRITADAVSSGFLPKVAGISVKDHFESIIDTQSFCSVKMSKFLREGKRHRDIFLTFDSARGCGQYLSYDVSKDPRVQLKNLEVKDLPFCVQDLLSSIYRARLLDLQIGHDYPMVVSDDGVVKPVRVKARSREVVHAVAGSYTALRIETVAVFGGLFKQGGTLVVWVTDDARRIPVQFEAKVKLGKVYGTLKKRME